jgi:NodT family efflux transporter outer membrane factor (OMF) lipoprotein
MRRLRPTITALSCLLAMLLSTAGCGTFLKTPFRSPETTVPRQWIHGATTVSVPTGNWWRSFGDPNLDRLVDEALRRNNDLAAATIKVRRAKLQADIAADQRWPAFSSNITASNSNALSGSQMTANSYSMPGTVTYEADFWGRVGSLSDAAAWEARATAEDRESTALSLVGTTIKLYWLIAYLNERLTLSEESIAYAQKTLDLVNVQYQVGAASALEVAEATQNLASQEASHTQLKQQKVESNNALAILYDGPPGDVCAYPKRLPEGAPPAVAEGLPAELLGRRPDLRAAELRLRKYLSTVDATKANYLPTVSLTGTLGTSSVALATLVQNPVAVLGAGLVLPFLQWKQMQLNIAASKSEYEEAVVNFRQTLYQAFSDVENALSARTHYVEQATRLCLALTNAHTTERMYEIRYRAGYTSLQVWLDAQEKRRSSEVQVCENRYNQFINYVTLCLALGGDASQTPDAPPSTSR